MKIKIYIFITIMPNVDALVCKNTILFFNKISQPHLSVKFIKNSNS